MAKELQLPRNTTRQAEIFLYGDIVRLLNRATGAVIVGFVLVHVLAMAVKHVPAFSAIKAATPWLPVIQDQPWIHALLIFSVVFHTLYGFKLLVLEMGHSLDYRTSFWGIVGLSGLFAIRELLRYVGI